MVLKKRTEYGFNGYQIPAMPRGCRSVRRKRSIRKSSADASQMCAIDLLATVAEELLLERESPPTQISATSEGPKTPGEKDIAEPDKVQSIKAEPCDQGSCDEGPVASDRLCQTIHQKHVLKECSQASSCGAFGPPSFIGRTDGSQKTGHGKESEAFPEAKVEVGIKRNGSGMFSGDHMDMDTKPPALVSSDSSVEVPPVRSRIARCRSLPKFQDDMDLVDRDDDENSSGCTHPYSLNSKSFRPQRVGDRRIRRLLSSKFWKFGPTLLKDGELFNRDSEAKSMFRSRKMCYTRQRTEHSSFKRRKLFERSSISTAGGRIVGDATARPLEKGIKVEPGGVAGDFHGGNGTSSSITSQKSSFKSDEYKVKIRIKSFKVPELFIEMPENATVGSLKRTVLETVTAMLTNGLRVGVILQGKKVRDDNKTLLQAGITGGEKLESLGFSLEPTPSQAPLQLPLPEDHAPLLQPCHSEPEPLARLHPLPTSDLVVPNATSGSSSGCHAESDLAPADPTPISKALVPVPSREDALAVVPVKGKSRRSEMGQRRIRRPFSVAEVEALVLAVEKLGTGRWRDVKIRAFDNAKHRTYVDLKDKWKTLVHTARISPQQRRGEPVPQELLDRVLAAHAHWSHHQSKLHAKQQQQQQPEQHMLEA